MGYLDRHELGRGRSGEQSDALHRGDMEHVRYVDGKFGAILMEDNAFASRNDDESGRISSIRKVIEEAKDKSEKNAAMLAMLDDLVYPETKDGSTLDVSFFSTIIAWHLVRCGWRP